MPGGTEELRGLQAETEDLENYEGEATETAEDSEAEPRKNESAKETVTRLLKESSVSDGSEDEEEVEIVINKNPLEDLSDKIEEEGKPPKGKKGKQKEASIEEEVEPPARFDAKQKEIFSKLPSNLKKAVLETVTNLEGVTTRAAQHYAQAANEAKSIIETIQPFIGKWAKRGFTAPAAIAALAATFDDLNHPDKALDTWLSLGKDIGVNEEVLEQFQGTMGGKKSNVTDISSHPQFLALQNQLKSVSDYINATQQKEFQSVSSSIVAEMAAVRDEKDPLTGSYRYPELHDNSFLDRVKPLVEALRKTAPELSYGDTLKRAYFSLTGKGDFSQFPARLPASQNQKTYKPADSPISVRGRSAPSQVMTSEIPKEALSKDPRDSVRWALEQLRRGN